MKVLFDQNIPRRTRRALIGLEVKTAREQGWDRLRNGDLLGEAEGGGFDVFVTADKKLAYQQNLTERRIAIVELTRNNWPLIEPRLDEIRLTVQGCKPGDYLVVDCSRKD